MLSQAKQTILLLGHGSRDPEAVKEFLDFAAAFQNHNGFRTAGAESAEIVCAFLELTEPTIPQALEKLAEQGVKKILAVPYFLFRAGHVKTEIPEMLAEFQRYHPEIEVKYANSLWPHRNLVELAKKRIQGELTRWTDSYREEADVLVVGRGATDSEAIDQFREATEQLRAEIVCRTFRHCFIALAEPKYTQALPEMLENGARRLIIFPFYLFTGILVKRIETQAKDQERHFPDATINLAPHLGSHPLMFEMLREKMLETDCAREFGK